MSFFMKLAQTEEYRMAIKITQMNLQLTEALHSHLELMIRQCKKLGIEFPDLDVTIELMNKEKELVNRISSIGLSPEMKRPQDSPVEETEPGILICSVFGYCMLLASSLPPSDRIVPGIH